MSDHTYCQNLLSLKGYVSDKATGNFISNANITAENGNRIISFTNSDAKGAFNFILTLEDTSNISVTFSHVNYLKKSFSLHYLLSLNDANLNVSLESNPSQLEEIKIESQWKRREINDTISFNVAPIITPAIRKVDELLSQIEGFKVSDDGKVSYKGVPISTVLINNEDLAGSNYGAVTKNLDASILEKVELIKNYNKNRILGGVSKTGELALNLKVKSNLSGKSSGSLTTTIGVPSKYGLDFNLLTLKSKVKSLVLSNFNNYSKNFLFGNLFDYSHQVPGRLASTSLNERNNISNIISKPELENEYIYSNKAQLLTPSVIYTLSDKIKISVKASHQYSIINPELFYFSQVVIDPLNSFNFSLQENLVQKNENNFIETKISFDNKKANAGSIQIHLQNGKLNQDFINVRKVKLEDSLIQKYSEPARSISFIADEAILLKNKSVLHFQNYTEFLESSIRQNTNTQRFADIFRIDSSFIQFDQGYNLKSFNVKTNLSLIKKFKDGSFNSFEIGHLQTVRNINSSLDGSNKQNTNKQNLIEKSDRFKSSKYYLGSQLKKKISSNFSININSEIGYGIFESDNVNNLRQNIRALLYYIQAGAETKLSKRLSFTINLSSEKALPSIRYFSYDSIITSNANLLNIASIITTTNTHLINFNLFKSTPKIGESYQHNLTTKVAGRDYINTYNVREFYTATQYLPVRNNIVQDINFTGKNYIFPIHSSIFYSTIFSHSSSKNILNESETRVNSNVYSSQLRLVSNLKSKLNFELESSLTYINVKQQINNNMVSNRISNLKLGAKAKFQYNNNFYIGISHDYLKFINASFNALNLYSTYKISQSSQFTIRATNLLNKKVFNQKSINFYSSSNQYYNLVPTNILLGYTKSF